MKRSRFRVKQAPSLGDFIRDLALLLLIFGGLMYLHTL